MTRDEWITRFAELLGTDAPTKEEIDTLLDVAGVAAHHSERTAAPLACYLLGRAGVDPVAGLARARQVGTDDPPGR